MMSGNFQGARGRFSSINAHSPAPPRWALIAKRGYEEQDLNPKVSVITKLKGISVTQLEDLGNRLWDVADFVKPSQVGAPILLQSADTLSPSSHQGCGVPGIVTGLAGKSLIGEIAWGRAMKRFWVAWAGLA